MWQYRTGYAFNSSPAIGKDGTVYAGSTEGYFYAFDPSGTVKWSVRLGGLEAGGVMSPSPALGADGTIYVGSHDNNVYALNPDGTVKWRYTTGYRVESSPAISADGTLYIGGMDNGYLYAFHD